MSVLGDHSGQSLCSKVSEKSGLELNCPGAGFTDQFDSKFSEKSGLSPKVPASTYSPRATNCPPKGFG